MSPPISPAMNGSRDMDDEEYIRMMVYMPDKIGKCVDALAAAHFSDPDMKSYFFAYILRLHQTILQGELHSSKLYLDMELRKEHLWS